MSIDYEISEEFHVYISVTEGLLSDIHGLTLLHLPIIPDDQSSREDHGGDLFYSNCQFDSSILGKQAVRDALLPSVSSR